MDLDIRYPIGLTFTVIGAILVIFGLSTADSAIYQRSLGINVNLYWGMVLFVGGALFLFFAWKGGGKKKDGEKH